MQIKKEFGFYASHRNQELVNCACSRPHGHRYTVFCYFEVKRKGNISTLFDEFDRVIEPMLKQEFDHRMLIDKGDPLYTALQQYEKDSGEDLGLVVLPFPTSVENLCYFLFRKIYTHFSNLERLEIQETRSSTVIYTKEDFARDYAQNL